MPGKTIAQLCEEGAKNKTGKGFTISGIRRLEPMSRVRPVPFIKPLSVA